jgi:hypothetical protein
MTELEQLQKDVTEIKTALKGYNGSKQGLIPAFEEHCKSDEKFRADYYKFKRACLAVFFTIIGASGIGISITKLTEILASR